MKKFLIFFTVFLTIAFAFAMTTHAATTATVSVVQQAPDAIDDGSATIVAAQSRSDVGGATLGATFNSGIQTAVTSSGHVIGAAGTTLIAGLFDDTGQSHAGTVTSAITADGPRSFLATADTASILNGDHYMILNDDLAATTGGYTYAALLVSVQSSVISSYYQMSAIDELPGPAAIMLC